MAQATTRPPTALQHLRKGLAGAHCAFVHRHRLQESGVHQIFEQRSPLQTGSGQHQVELVAAQQLLAQVLHLLGAVQAQQAQHAQAMAQVRFTGVVTQHDGRGFAGVLQRRVGDDIHPRLAEAPLLGQRVEIPAGNPLARRGIHCGRC